jgi:hypothetical protein
MKSFLFADGRKMYSFTRNNSGGRSLLVVVSNLRSMTADGRGFVLKPGRFVLSCNLRASGRKTGV